MVNKDYHKIDCLKSYDMQYITFHKIRMILPAESEMANKQNQQRWRHHSCKIFTFKLNQPFNSVVRTL